MFQHYQMNYRHARILMRQWYINSEEHKILFKYRGEHDVDEFMPYQENRWQYWRR